MKYSSRTKVCVLGFVSFCMLTSITLLYYHQKHNLFSTSETTTLSNNNNKLTKKLHKFYDETTNLYYPSNELIYISINTNIGNINQMYNLSQYYSHGIFKKENVFLVSDQPYEKQDDFKHFSYLYWPPSEARGDSGYAQAQHRFLYGLKRMYNIMLERNDTAVNWFMLSDDDSFLVPRSVLRIIGKYELQILEGKLDRNYPIVVGQTVHCDRIYGGSSVIFNKVAAGLIVKYATECINNFGLQYYDLTLYNCFNSIILNKEFEGKRTRCQTLFDEQSFNCCNFRLYCDYWTRGVDFVKQSWYEMFRPLTTLHYIKGNDYPYLRSLLPDNMFKPQNGAFGFSRKELETGFDTLSLPKVFSKDQPTGSAIPIDDIRKQVNNQINFANLYTIQNQMEAIHKIIFDHWTDNSLSQRVTAPSVENDLSADHIGMMMIPSRNFKKYGYDKNVNSDNYDMYAKPSKEHINKQGVSQVFECNESGGEKSFFSCIQQYKLSNSTKWLLVGTQTTKLRISKLIPYLKTIDSKEVWFVGGFLSAQECILSQKNRPAAPLGAGVLLSRKFIEEYQKLVQSLKSTQLGNAFYQLLSPKSMVLSSDMFYSHAREYYCTYGIKDPMAWIEMKKVAKDTDPTVITIKPEKSCWSSWENIDAFIDRKGGAWTDYPGVKQIYEPCNY